MRMLVRAGTPCEDSSVQWFYQSIVLLIHTASIQANFQFTKDLLLVSQDILSAIAFLHLAKDEIHEKCTQLLAFCKFAERKQQFPARLSTKQDMYPTPKYETDDTLFASLKLSFSLTTCPLGCTSHAYAIETISALVRYTAPLDTFAVSEIVDACRFLISADIAAKDLAASSRWFRMSTSKTQADAIVRMGFKQYRKDNNQVDSVLVGSYIKKLLTNVTDGLVPNCIRFLLIELLENYTDQEDCPQEVTAAVYGLLSLNKHRLQVMRLIGELAERVFKHGLVDPIKPIGLARIIKVSDEGAFDFATALHTTGDTKALTSELDKWNNVWGYILLHQRELLHQVTRI